MVGRRRIDVIAARGLDADDDVSEAMRRQMEDTIGEERIVLRRAPLRGDLIAERRGERGDEVAVCRKRKLGTTFGSVSKLVIPETALQRGYPGPMNTSLSKWWLQLCDANSTCIELVAEVTPRRPCSWVPGSAAEPAAPG